MSATEFETDGVARQHIRRGRFIAWSVLIASIAAGIVQPLLVGFLIYSILGSLVALADFHFGAAHTPPRRSYRAGRVTLEAHPRAATATTAGGKVIARAPIADGWLDSFGGAHQVVLRARGGDLLWIRVRDVAEGHRVLRAAGVAPDQHVFRIRLVSHFAERFSTGWRALFGVTFVYFAPILGILGAVRLFTTSWSLTPALAMEGAALSLVLGAVMYKVLQLLMPRTAVVGTDGVAIEGLRTRRFVPFANVRAVVANSRGVWLQHDEHSSTLLATMPRAATIVGTVAANTQVLLDRVHAAMTMGVGDVGAAQRFHVLDRKGRGLRSWLDEVRALVQREAAADYRNVAIGREEIASVLDDTTAPAERRIAAAAALATVADPTLRERVRVAVDTCANARLRIALEKAARNDLVDEDLDELSTPPAVARV